MKNKINNYRHSKLELVLQEKFNVIVTQVLKAK